MTRRVYSLLLVLFAGLLPFKGHGQDERYLRKMLTGEVGKSVPLDQIVREKYRVHSKFYRMDLGGDGQKEGLVYSKIDGIDYFVITDGLGRELRRFRLDPMYADSALYKINFRDLSPKTKLLVLHFFEGKNSYVDYEGRARLYFITVDEGDLKRITFQKGPMFFQEYAGFRDHYHQRFYNTELIDLNNDGVKEVRVKHRKNVWVYFYNDFGKWRSI